jgi:hypothetical protein
MIIEYLIVDVFQLLLGGRKMLKLKEKIVHETERRLKKTDLNPYSGKSPSPPCPCCHGVLLTNPREHRPIRIMYNVHLVSKMEGITLVPVAGQLIYPSPAPGAEDQRSHNLGVAMTSKRSILIINLLICKLQV